MSIGALTGVQPADAGVASGLINTTQQIGGAIGVAIATTIATTFTTHYLNAHAGASPLGGAALTHGFQVAFYVLAGIAAAGAILAAMLLEPKTAQPTETIALADQRRTRGTGRSVISARHEAARVDAFTQLVRAAARTTAGPGGPRGVAAATGLPVVERTSQSARHRAGCPARSQARRGRRRRASTNACFERARGRAARKAARPSEAATTRHTALERKRSSFAVSLCDWSRATRALVGDRSSRRGEARVPVELLRLLSSGRFWRSRVRLLRLGDRAWCAGSAIAWPLPCRRHRAGEGAPVAGRRHRWRVLRAVRARR